jgi:hypothetical protein
MTPVSEISWVIVHLTQELGYAEYNLLFSISPESHCTLI